MSRRTAVVFSTLGGDQSSTLYPGATGAPVVVIAPALGVRATYYRKLAEELAARGIAAVPVDLPGQPESPVRAGRSVDWGYAEYLEHYRAACIAAVQRAEASGAILLGHSIGGQVALMLAGQDVPELLGVVLVASGTPWWRAFDGIGKVRTRFGTQLAARIAKTLGYFPGERLGFGGREARTFMRQWARVAKTGRYDFAGFPGEDYLAAPGPPVLAIRLRGDTFAPERAVRSVLDRVVARQVTCELWEDPPHGGDHNRWPSAPGHVVDRVAAFAASL